MNEETGTNLCKIVRNEVLRVFDRLDTCVASTRVLEAVLREHYDIALSPHVVRLRILSPEAILIAENEDLGVEAKHMKLAALGKGKGILGIEEGFHVIGVAQTNDGKFLFDPSIDQINPNSKVCRFEPICISYARIKVLNDGKNEWIYFDEKKCRVMYTSSPEKADQILSGEAWTYDYTSIVESVNRAIGSDVWEQ